MKKNQKWLVTVTGFSGYYNPPQTFLSKVIELPKGETPVTWFLSCPTCYCRFDFIPDALLNYAKVPASYVEKKSQKNNQECCCG